MKKYIFYIDSMQMGGAQRVMNNLIDFFVAQGNEIKLVNDIQPKQSEPEYKINNSVERIFLDEQNLFGIKKNIKRIKKLRRIIKQERPDLILSFLGPPNLRMLVATLGLRVRKIVSVRNDPNKEYGSGLKKIITKILFLLADGCVFQTEDVKKYFFSPTVKKSTVIFNPVNIKFYNHSWSGTGSDIVLIGRLQEQKNPLLALKAFSIISNKFSDYKLKFYGDEELSDEIISKAKAYGIDKKIKIMKKTNNVEEVLENAALFILSSNYEGMPNALMEAMTVGTPVISTDCPCGGPRSLIKNDKQGLLVPCNDSIALASAIERILSDSQYQKEMSINEKRRSLEFHPDIILEKWRKFLDFDC